MHEKCARTPHCPIMVGSVKQTKRQKTPSSHRLDSRETSESINVDRKERKEKKGGEIGHRKWKARVNKRKQYRYTAFSWKEATRASIRLDERQRQELTFHDCGGAASPLPHCQHPRNPPSRQHPCPVAAADYTQQRQQQQPPPSIRGCPSSGSA